MRGTGFVGIDFTGEGDRQGRQQEAPCSLRSTPLLEPALAACLRRMAYSMHGEDEELERIKCVQSGFCKLH
jgi:hypothetical protein